MKVLISTLLCGCIAACVSFSASAAAKTYVVPAGTAGNTPEAPYDTWAKAANDPRAAANATDAEGTVYILGGSYPDAMHIAPENNVHVKIMATQDETGAFGEMVMGRKLVGYSTVISSSDDKRRFQVDGGTIKLIPTGSDVFTEYLTGGAWGDRQHVRLVLTGSQTKLDTTSATSTYIGYTTKNYKVVVKDGAQLVTKGCNVCRHSASSDMDFLVANGASVTCNGSFNFANPSGASVVNGMLTISNATLSVTNNSSINIGLAAFSKNIRMTTAGERPLAYASHKFTIEGEGSALVMNVAEAPFGGYAESVVGGTTTRAAICSKSSFAITNGADFRVEGVVALSARILAEQTPPLSASWTLIEAGAGDQTIGDERITAVNMQLVADGFGNFYLEKSSDGRTLYLKYEYKVSDVYVTPEGTAGNAPGFPYNSWALAANSVKTGAQAVAVGGTVWIASGTYDPDPGVSTQWNCFPSRRAVFRAVASKSDPSPGNVILSKNGFASGYVNKNPDRYNITLAYGTFTFAMNTSGQCFLEYADNGLFNKDNRCQMTVTGEQTTLDNSNADFYIGMTSYNTMLRVTDHARCLTKTVHAADKSGIGTKVLIDSSATFTNATSFTLANGCKDVTVTVSNATLQTQSVAVNQSANSTSNIWLNILDHGVLSLTGTSFSPFKTLTSASGVVFDDSTFDQTTVAFSFAAGTNNTLIARNGARVNVKSLTLGASGENTGFVFLVDNAAVSTPNACTLNGDAKLKLDVSKVALDGTAPTFVSAGTLTVGGDATIELAGVADLKSRAEAANVRRCKVTLLKATSGLGVSDAAIQAMCESLPEGTTLQKTSTALTLRVGPPKGVVLDFR